MRTLRLHIRHQARHLEIATRSYNELQMAWARASAIAALAIVGSAFVPAFITTAIILPPLDVATAAVAAISDDGKLLQPQSVTVSDTTDRGGYQVSLSFTSPIISDGQNQDIAFRIADALGRPARDIEFTLVLSELTATGSEPRLIAQGQALNGTGQVEREFDSVGWYQVDLSLQNETASFRIFAGGVDLETDDEVYSPGQAIKVSGTTYPNDTVIITLSGSDDGSEATADESNVSSTAPTSIANRTVSTDEDGTFNSTQIMWPTEDGSTKDGLYTVTAYSSLLGMKSESRCTFQGKNPQ